MILILRIQLVENRHHEKSKFKLFLKVNISYEFLGGYSCNSRIHKGCRMSAHV